jgi:putative membrane protein
MPARIFTILSIIFFTLNSCSNISDEDRLFMKELGSSSLMEVKISQLALQKTSNEKILEFAHLMINQYNQFSEEYIHLLKKINENITIVMNDQNGQTVNDLSKLNGDAFEKKYVEDVTTDYTNTIQAFNIALKNAKNDDYKKFLQRRIKFTKRYYELAQRLHSAIAP